MLRVFIAVNGLFVMFFQGLLNDFLLIGAVIHSWLLFCLELHLVHFAEISGPVLESEVLANIYEIKAITGWTVGILDKRAYFMIKLMVFMLELIHYGEETLKLTLYIWCQVEWVLCRLWLYIISSWGHLGVRVLGWMFWELLVLICEELILEQQSDVFNCKYLIRTQIEWF